MHDIKISIIVPIYNVELYCQECFDSLLSQTLEDIEVLLVNDGTKDSSGEIAKRYSEKHPKLFRYFEKPNGGLSDARNYAIPLAKGQYIAFVDSDDYVREDMYSLLWQAADKTNAEIIECELDKVWTQKKERIVLPENYAGIKDYMLRSRVCAWNKLYKTSWIRDLQVRFPKGLLYEDICFFYKIVPYMTHLPITVHEPLYYYRQREGSILSASNKRILEIHDIFRKLFKDYSEKGLDKEYYHVIEYKYARTLLKSFLLRMLKMPDKVLAHECIVKSWSILNKECPNWKSNPYMKSCSIDNFYLKTLSPSVLKLMERLIH